MDFLKKLRDEEKYPDTGTLKQQIALDVEHATAIIRIERPDAILPTVGGQTALNLAVDLAKAGILDPQGEAVEGSLRKLGFPVHGIRVGRLIDLAHTAGIDAYLITYPGEGHVPYNHRTEIHDQTRNFLWWHMDLEHAAR